MNKSELRQKKYKPSLSQRERGEPLLAEFDRRWHAGERPRIEDYVEKAADDDREYVLRELIATELRYRHAAGEHFRREDYLDRFGDAESVVESALESFHAVRGPASGFTGDQLEGELPVNNDHENSIPAAIGRYKIIRELGRGGFAVVYLARDTELDRNVALKVPRVDRFESEEAVEFFADEARKAAQLDHPGIVRVLDVRREPKLVYIVQQYLSGGDLSQHVKSGHLDYRQIAELMILVAEAVGYAHQEGFVHLDLKPANILLDEKGKPYVADFGLALHESMQSQMGGEVMGTYAYMSPEQARGETNRLNGCSDIWSLGIILYELLVGKRPFRAESNNDLVDQIKHLDPRPPRQVNPKVPRELSRICLACLNKRATDRYEATANLIDDLSYWLNEASRTSSSAATVEPDATAGNEDASKPVKIIPQGLRSFGPEHADFYLDLLPGPHDREGLPRRVRFWKQRMDETDPDETFAIGLMYGPSGCGKSSLIKAGIFPRLGEKVLPIYVEATAADTEVRLLKTLRKRCPELPEGNDLPQMFRTLRCHRGSKGRKIVVVIDQFEQWLHAHAAREDSQLIPALRHCDGGGLQCVVLVRDDFWLSATRFMQALETPLVEEKNSALVDLFDVDHAIKVLTDFGRAFGKLPDVPVELTEEQTHFLNQAVSNLADEEDKVACVRLAIFAEMMRGRPWTAFSLTAVGGIEGIGVTFLDQTFSAKTAPPVYRLHEEAIRNVLSSLMPDLGTNIKGQMRSYDDLLKASGYGDDPEKFHTVLQTLDTDVRLITPTEPDDDPGEANNETAKPYARYYQLAHDYLVPSLRAWLTREQNKTRKGRAELKLAERAALWNAKPENRHLPSILEWSSIRTLTEKQKWSEPQRKMMGKAGWVIGLYSGLAGIAVVLVVCVGLFISGQVEEQQNANYAKSLVESLSAANTADVKDLVVEINKYQQWAIPLLNDIVAEETSSPTAKLHASLALVKDDPSQVDFLLRQLLVASPDDMPVIVSFLEPHKEQLKKQLWKTIQTGSNSQRIRAAAALAQYNGEDKQWEQEREDVVTALVSVPASESDEWIEMLRPVGSIFADPLEQRFQDRSEQRSNEHPIVAAALSVYLKDKPESLTPLILLADNDREFQPLLSALRNHSQSVIPELQARIKQSPPKDAGPANRDAFWKMQANAAACLLELGETESVWPLFQQTPDPSLRSFLIDRLARLGATPDALAVKIKLESDPASRYALILALGQFDAQNLSSGQRQSFADQLLTLYRDALDPGVHSAAGWTLRNWKQADRCQKIDVEVRQVGRQQRHWFVNSQGQTFAVINGPVEFLMGEKTERTEPKKVTLPYSFAVATHEVTVEQFQKFRRDHKHNAQYAQQADGPVNMVSWYDAVTYCNWLNEQEDIPKDQWCYEPNDKGEYAEGMKIAPDYLSRTGYRLPTDEEWEFICRAGSTSTYGFGEPVELLRSYAWYSDNSESHMWSVGMQLPNRYGAFDMHGNTYEWCHSLYSPRADQADVEVKTTDRRVLRGGSFLRLTSYVRSANRYDYPPSSRGSGHGFRPSRTYNLSP